MATADIIVSVSVLISAASFVWGVSAWRREFVGRRRIELAESVLALFYEAEDAIRAIRNPFSGGSEGQSRRRSEGERPEESQLLDQAYVAIERYNTREPLFAQLRASRYRFMATFGKDAVGPFKEIDDVIHEILVAARMLGTHYWQRQGRERMTPSQRAEHLERMHAQERVFWNMGDAEDPVGPKVRRAVQGIEKIAEETVRV